MFERTTLSVGVRRVLARTVSARLQRITLGWTMRRTIEAARQLDARPVAPIKQRFSPVITNTMRIVIFVAVAILVSCNRQVSVGTSNMWLNGYNRIIVLPSSGDSLGIHKAMASAFAERGFDVVVSTGERAETDHKTGLHTMVVSYGDSQRIGGGVEVYCRDYTRGLLLTDNARDPYSYRMQINVGDPAGKAKEYTSEWIDKYRNGFDANAVLLRPAWWTNERRDTRADGQH